MIKFFPIDYIEYNYKAVYRIWYHAGWFWEFSGMSDAITETYMKAVDTRTCICYTNLCSKTHIILGFEHTHCGVKLL